MQLNENYKSIDKYNMLSSHDERDTGMGSADGIVMIGNESSAKKSSHLPISDDIAIEDYI